MSHAEDDTLASASLPNTTLAGAGPALPELVGNRYRLARWLGGGGMGRVYAAVDTELGEHVALKVLREGLSEDALERFRREVRLTRRIQHRNVARMFDIGEHNGVRFLTMELVEGPSLVQAPAPLSWRRLAGLATQLLEGLAAAHAAGVIHRDLKPDNVLVERATERAVITDFGIARSLDDAQVTQVGAVVGTPRYMSPEQLAGGELDARTDLFSLGVMLYELATGARPWHGDHAIAIAVAQATQPMRPLVAEHVPPAFVDLVTRCLALAPQDRPASARAAAALLAGELPPLAAGAPAPAPRPRPAIATLPAPAQTLAPAPQAAPPSSIAVLPVAAATDDAYLAEGILEDLIDGLSTGNLRVRPAGHVRALHAPDPREVGRTLGVDHVVTAALRRTATGLRVSARLISVADGFQVWAHRVDCAEGEILAVTDQLARGIAGALSTRATSGTRPTDPRAVELYLRARAELRRFWGEHAAAAAELLDRAAAIAPDSEPILAARALACVQAWVMTTEAAYAPRARAALERGLATGHGEAYLASAIYRLNNNEHERAGADLALALARSPMSSPAHEIAGRVLVEIADADEARVHFETAIGLDPGRATVIATDLARLDGLAGDFASASRRLAPLLADPDPAIQHLGAVYDARMAGWRGDGDGMAASARRFPSGNVPHATVIQNFLAEVVDGGALFEPAVWRRFLAQFDEIDRPQRQQLMGLQLLVEISLVMGRNDVALEALAQLGELGLMDIVWLDCCPVLGRVADTAAFRAVRDRVSARAARVLAAFRANR